MRDRGLASCHLGKELSLSALCRCVFCLVFCMREGAGGKSELQVTREKSIQRPTQVSVSFVDNERTQM